MSNAEKMNFDQLPGFVGEVMGWAVSNWFYMALLIWLLTIGVGELSRIIESALTDFAPYVRSRFWGYFYGDWFLSGLGFVTYWRLEDFKGSDEPYVSPFYYLCMFSLGVVVSIGLEVWAMRANRKNPEKGYTWQQELMPSKLVHTIGLALVFGLLLSVAPAVIVAGSWVETAVTVALILLLAGVWVGFNILDNVKRDMTYLLVEAHPHPSRFRQMEEWRAGQVVTV